MQVVIINCQYCDKDHYNLEFEPLNNPSDEYKYRAMCPNTQQPLLLAVKVKGVE